MRFRSGRRRQWEKPMAEEADVKDREKKNLKVIKYLRELT